MLASVALALVRYRSIVLVKRGLILPSVLRVREVSVFGSFFVQTWTEIVRDLRKCPFYRKCPLLGGVR